MRPKFFRTPAELRAWLEAHHDSSAELLVGFYKRGTGRPSLTWPQSVDEALCFGWIDGVRRSLDEESYTIRFTPRRPSSIWSAINIRRMGELEAEGRVQAAGRAAFARRKEDRSGVYSHEQRDEARLDPAFEARLRADGAAAAFFDGQPRWYRQAAIRWVMTAKREETRERRLATLIADSAKGRPIPPLKRPPGKGKVP